MGRIAIAGLMLGIFLSGCSYSTLTKIEKKYGRPARVEIECFENSAIACDEDTYYNNKDAIKHIVWFYYWQTRRTRAFAAAGSNVGGAIINDYTGWLCWEIIADKNGDVLQHRKYIEQPNRPKQGRTPVQGRDKPLPGMKKSE